MSFFIDHPVTKQWIDPKQNPIKYSIQTTPEPLLNIKLASSEISTKNDTELWRHQLEISG